MLERSTADIGSVIHRALVVAALATCGLVLVSFSLFARDQLAGASVHQQNELIRGSVRTPAVPAHRRQPRRFIDGAAHALISPFTSLVQSTNQWVVHGVPTIFALLAYGLGLGFLARFSNGMT
jgi:hypothetical protein